MSEGSGATRRRWLAVLVMGIGAGAIAVGVSEEASISIPARDEAAALHEPAPRERSAGVAAASPSVEEAAEAGTIDPGSLPIDLGAAMEQVHFAYRPGEEGRSLGGHATIAVVGDACDTDDDCESGFCTDGVCCDSACGGGALDCQACSDATGAATDGTCGPTTGTACRSA